MDAGSHKILLSQQTAILIPDLAKRTRGERGRGDDGEEVKKEEKYTS